MEQITKRDGDYYYGERRCDNADEAYGFLREDYHKSLGKQFYKRFDRVGQRKERIHSFGFFFDEDSKPKVRIEHRVKYRMLGLVGIHYYRIVGVWDYKEVSADGFDEWFDAAFSQGSGTLRLVGRKDKSGRTSKRLKARYR